jgi:fructoselysine 6-phosphate deglycase
MASSIDRQLAVDGLSRAAAQLSDCAALGQQLSRDIDRIYFVAHGSAHRAMQGMQYWIEHYSPSLEVRRYFPSELTTQKPARLDARTLVLLASKSGTTPETVAAAEYLQDKPCVTVAFTLHESAPLAGLAQHRFLAGEASESFVALFMMMQALVGGLLAERDQWPLLEDLLTSLAALPDAIVDAAEQNEARGAADAKTYENDRNLYLVAAGPGFTPAYVFGVCIVMEMLGLHSYPIEAAEFFHGPFEIVDETTPLILIVGEDPSRPLMERVVRF